MEDGTYNTQEKSRSTPTGVQVGYKECIERIAEEDRNLVMQSGERLPSRRNALFVAKKEDVRFWYNYIEKRNPNTTLSIYEVELTGLLLWTNAALLRTNQYWCPDEKVDEEPEGVFEGDFKIIRICRIEDFS